MSADKTVTEREAVLRERWAFTIGAKLWSSIWDGTRLTVTKERAKEAFPLPKVERPRVVADTVRHWEYRAIDGTIECRWAGRGGFNEQWGPVNRTLEGIDVTAARVAMWADLLANPTELVEASE